MQVQCQTDNLKSSSTLGFLNMRPHIVLYYSLYYSEKCYEAKSHEAICFVPEMSDEALSIKLTGSFIASMRR